MSRMNRRSLLGLFPRVGLAAAAVPLVGRLRPTPLTAPGPSDYLFEASPAVMPDEPERVYPGPEMREYGISFQTDATVWEQSRLWRLYSVAERTGYSAVSDPWLRRGEHVSRDGRIFTNYWTFHAPHDEAGVSIGEALWGRITDVLTEAGHDLSAVSSRPVHRLTEGVEFDAPAFRLTRFGIRPLLTLGIVLCDCHSPRVDIAEQQAREAMMGPLRRKYGHGFTERVDTFVTSVTVGGA